MDWTELSKNEEEREHRAQRAQAAAAHAFECLPHLAETRVSGQASKPACRYTTSTTARI